MGRPSGYGNQYRIGPNGTSEEIVKKFRSYIRGTDLGLLRRDLKGKDLACWCASQACHADVFLEITNENTST